MSDPRILFPLTSGNPNVPDDDVLVVVEIKGLRGKITTSYYVDRAGNVWSVRNWTTAQPEAVSMGFAARIAGLEPIQLGDLWLQWKDGQI